MEPEPQLYSAAFAGYVASIDFLLKTCKEIDVNWQSYNGTTSLAIACSFGHVKAASRLLAHPLIDVNSKSVSGHTAFSSACVNGQLGCVKLLLDDPRVLINEPTTSRETPLEQVVRYDRYDVMKWCIASGRKLDFGGAPVQIPDDENPYISHIDSLLLKFRDNPTRTRREVRKELGVIENEARIFALTVFFCDELLEVKEGETGGAARFFTMSSKLPMELQMILCHRSTGSAGGDVPGWESEMAFKELAKKIA
jgi:hypothetical protein